MSFPLITSFKNSALNAVLSVPKAVANSSWKARGLVTLVALSALFILVRICRTSSNIHVKPQSSEKPDSLQPEAPKPVIQATVHTPAKLQARGEEVNAWLKKAEDYAEKACKQQLEEIREGTQALKESYSSLGITQDEATEYPNCIQVKTVLKPEEEPSQERDTAIADIFMIALMCARDPSFQSQTLGCFRAFSESLRMYHNTPGHLGAMTRTVQEQLPLQIACPDLGDHVTGERGVLQGYHEDQAIGDIIGGLNNTTSRQESSPSLGFQEQWRVFFSLLHQANQTPNSVAGIQDFLDYKKNFLVKEGKDGRSDSSPVFYILFKDLKSPVQPKTGATRNPVLRIARDAQRKSFGGTQGNTPVRGDGGQSFAGTPLKPRKLNDSA